jgi:acyl-CoA thioesterase-2
VGDLEKDTAVEDLGDGRYRATMSSDWEIWGPMGGYVASVALRAAGAASPFPRPASFSCQYLGVATFDDVDIAVTTNRSARTALAQRVEITQAGKPIMEATVWSVGDVDGLVHDESAMPDAAPAHELKTLEEQLADAGLEPFPTFTFWQNLDVKPLSIWTEQPTEPMPAVWQEWLRFTPTATFEDPWVDACRSLVLLDVQSWPAASRPHVHEEREFYGPSLDLYVAFHDPQPASEWLFADGRGPIAKDGLMGWNGRLWSETGALVASGAGQLLCRRMPGR